MFEILPTEYIDLLHVFILHEGHYLELQKYYPKIFNKTYTIATVLRDNALKKYFYCFRYYF